MNHSLQKVFTAGFTFWILFAIATCGYLYRYGKKDIRFGIDLVGGTYITLEVQSEQKAKQSEVLECTWYARIWCGLLSFAQSIFAKFHEWFCVAICFVQSIFCKIHEWICRLFGS